MKPTKWLVAAGLAATSALVAVPASATVLYNEVEQDTSTQSFPANDENPLCPGLNLQVDVSSRNRVQFVQRRPGTTPYYGARYQSTFVWTNLDTGKTFTIYQRVNDRDLRIVDNDDGTITIDVMATGGSRIVDDEGRQLFSDAGQIRYRVVIALNDPLDPEDDEEVSFEFTRESNGTNDLKGRDFCDDLAEFTS
jgi:hypothetical protein